MNPLRGREQAKGSMMRLMKKDEELFPAWIV